MPPPPDSPFDADRVHGPRPATSAPRRRWWRRRHEDPDAALIARARAPLTRSRRIVVASRKGGVGKTSVALMLGHAFAARRLDRVIAVDGDPDGGTLAHRVARADALHIGDLLEAMRDVHGYTSIRRFTVGTPSGLEVLATPADPDASRTYHTAEYLRILAKLNGSYGLIVLDTGTGVLDNVTAGILDAADQLVLVAGPGSDESRAADQTLDWLEEQAAGHLVEGAVTVLNTTWPLDGVDLDPVAAHFATRTRAVVRLPFDAHLADGAVVDPLRLAAPTRHAFLELAATVADGFALDTPRRTSPTPSGHA
ncbi:MinD/ParA family ATP-binding protein [Euzebya rosea]|uniref:MinD/ParA family ATP-binding protein n=1 Tax=Euzebya rosea TaxID=2052804 RepID=UPI000D3E1988|nr:MinD/ParA family protein [Euzebya rosea]